MKPRLFLTGPSGYGKSDMIRQELGGLVHRAGGFCTCRDRDTSGTVRGFEIHSADGYGPRDLFLDLTGEQPRIDAVFIQGRFGLPVFAAVDLHESFLYCTDQRWIFTSFCQADLFFH